MPHPTLQAVLAFIRAQVAPTEAEARGQRPWYLAAAYVPSALFGLMLLPAAFRTPWLAALDTRQHVYWMRRYLDPGLFPGDPHSDYFQAVAPAGYAALYRAFAALGVDPLILSKLLPMALGLVVVHFAFRLAMRVYPVPAAAFVASFLAAQYAWMNPDMTTGTPRAFVLPALLAFLDALAARHAGGQAAAIAATAALYPQYVLVELGILALAPLGWDRGPRLRAGPGELGRLAGVALVGVAGLALYAWQTARFGPVVSLAEARAMPEFQPGGFRAFFTPDAWAYWVTSPVSGFAHSLRPHRCPPLVALALALPLAAAWQARRLEAPRLAPAAWLLPKAVVAVTAIFLIAHATLFHLYQPGRYTSQPIALVGAVGAGAALLMLAAALQAATRRSALLAPLTALTLIVGAGGLVAQPFVAGTVPYRRVYGDGRESPGMLAFFEAQPKQVQVASLSEEIAELPMFARRQVLVALTMNPYHLGFYRPMRAAVFDLIAAQYSPDPQVLARFLRAYRVDFLVVDRFAFRPAYLHENRWLAMFRVEAEAARAGLQAGPAVTRLDPSCVAYLDAALVVFRADRILATLPVGGQQPVGDPQQPERR